MPTGTQPTSGRARIQAKEVPVNILVTLTLGAVVLQEWSLSAAAASPGNTQKIMFSGHTSEPMESETQGWGSTVCVLTSPR